MRPSERASEDLEWPAAHTLEAVHPSRTVEDHCTQSHLSIDERLDDARMVRADAKMRWRQQVML